MVDLHTQYLRIKPEIDAAMQKIFDTTSFIQGAEVKEFSQNLAKYLDCKYVIPCANGTDALQIALMALELKPGDEVITTPFTFVATVEVIALLGLKPVFVEVNPHTFTLDENELERAITPKTKAIIPVQLFGQAANMEAICEIAAKYDIPVIEDNAQAIGADFTFKNGKKQKVGTIGHIGCTSFFPSKNLGCYGDGGAITTNDAALAKKMQIICNHGSETRYYHESIGINSRLDSLQAAVLNVKLPLLDSYNRARQAAAEHYDNALKNNPFIALPARTDYSTHVFHQYTLLVSERRDELVKYLTEKQIPTGVYYPVPLHLQKAYSYYGFKAGDFPVSESLSQHCISLPIHTELTAEQQDYICQSILEFYS
ncbi:MAG: hypothetical protein RI894_1665 [Bacteroidota bacterium]|jgi:dTDP-4-amino-4,6-dideoxygalactose transaminase